MWAIPTVVALLSVFGASTAHEAAAQDSETSSKAKADLPEDVQFLQDMEKEEALWRAKASQTPEDLTNKQNVSDFLQQVFLSKEEAQGIEVREIKCSAEACTVELLLSNSSTQLDPMKETLRRGMEPDGPQLWGACGSIPIHGSNEHVLMVMKMSR